VEIASFLPLSLSDDPGRVSAVVFLPGCNFRCPFCHNPDLVLPERAESRRRADPGGVLGEIERRASFLDGVVISGGEPTLQPDLADFAAAIRSLGLRVKLDTNGSRPDVLRRLAERRLVDYVAMDLKAPGERYGEFAGVAVDAAAIAAAIAVIRSRVPDYEFRTTVAPGLAREDLLLIAEGIRGAKRYVLQPFRVPNEKSLIDPAWETRVALSAEELRSLWPEVAALVAGGGVRA
jgi:pyruvate formate lyase activating enzyme